MIPDLSVTGLLDRPLRKIPTVTGAQQIDGVTVLVTGAAGSVGSALVNRLLRTGAARVVAIDHHEASLFRLGRDVAAGGKLDLRLADVRNELKIGRILAEARPSVIFHLAAYKHVPFGETEPDETVSVNVLATASIARLAIDHGTGHFVYPSSDKAVNPPSLYGATKRIAEESILACAANQSSTDVHVVRYVNVLGTSGSVIETFARQAQAGQPLTLTDDRMTRYWMAMDEATDLLLHSLDLGHCSRSLLDTGDPIPVRAMATRIYRMVRGGSADPEVVLTGARPGERLAEELFSASESPSRCEEDPVMRVVHSRQDACGARAPDVVHELRQVISSASPAEIRARTMDFARELQ